MMNKKAIGLLSGGLDSTLAVKVILEMGIEVLALNFLSPFCSCTSKKAGCKSEALKVTKKFGIKLKTIFLGDRYLAMLNNPKYGYGRNFNPCIDCRIMMYKDSKKIMFDEGASFVFTGEVLGQRPMSQRFDSMNIIERDSGLKGLILRPLSAQYLRPTLPETNGIVDRDRLLKLKGRSRKAQMALAEQKGIIDYPCASGGCLLTDHHFSSKLKDLYKFQMPISLNDVRLLRVGRHLRINDCCKIVVGRDKEENEKLEKLVQPADYLFKVIGYKGPLVVAKGEIGNRVMKTISSITAHYSRAPKSTAIPVEISINPNQEPLFQKVRSLEGEAVKRFLI